MLYHHLFLSCHGHMPCGSFSQLYDYVYMMICMMQIAELQSTVAQRCADLEERSQQLMAAEARIAELADAKQAVEADLDRERMDRLELESMTARTQEQRWETYVLMHQLLYEISTFK